MMQLVRGMLFTILLAMTLAPALALGADPSKAQIITGNEQITQCISPVHISQVDGRERQLPANRFELTPGMHTLQGTAKINLTYCPAPRQSDRSTVSPLNAMFEAGKTYYVGLDHSSPDREDWRIVVWKVEDMSR